uniref:Pre-mRNA-processing factor 17 n=1 Tax=Amphora coffeiformis TaxID=265554 RepID=A0A7S3P8G6_9STRA
MYQPVHGPQADDPSRALTNRAQALETNVAFDETAFHEQRNAFQRSGQALAPTEDGTEIRRTTLGYHPQRLEKFAVREEVLAKRPRRAKEPDVLVQGSDDEAEYGVWGPPTQEETWMAQNKITQVQAGGVESLAPEQLAERAYIKERNRQKGILEEEKEQEGGGFDKILERKMAHLLPPKINDDGPCEPSTTFHGPQEFDYQGRSWIAPPAGLGAILADGKLDMDHHKCFVPKKCVARFTGHTKGVHRIRLFPRSGHLLLSGGLDGKCKVWSVAEKQVMRTYIGHTAAVRDVEFNHDGSKFVSASFDRYLRLWNTESGQVEQTFTNRKVPYVVKFYPHDDNFFVVGCSDNRIVTYNATTAEITQEYNHHLAPVNAILFVEEGGTKMVSSSDDKKVLVWEWDIGVPIKYISDPTMHSMPCMELHPSQTVFVGQSLDNTIACFHAGKRFAPMSKKFTGHIVSGYACQMCFSPDGRCLVSGDGNGNLFFWDWKKHKIMQKYRAHTAGPAICAVWHPIEPSTMFSCGWDGVIKMWQ